MSSLSCSTPSTDQTAARIPRSTPRSQWSVTRSDYSGGPPVNLRRARHGRTVHLPHGCQYVAWVLSLVVIAGCAAVTVLLGFRFGKVKSIQWLQSLFFSLMQCVFITHPFLILLVSVVMAIRYRRDLSVFDSQDDRVIEEQVKVEVSEVKDKDGPKDEFDEGMAARQRSRYLRFARPPQEKQLIEARNQTIKEKKASAIFSETTLFVLQFILLVFMAFGKDQRPVFSLNETLKGALVRGGVPSFDGLQTVPQWWQWAHGHLLRSLFWDEWYNGRPTHFSNDYIENSVLIGHVNLRQLRIAPAPCSLPPPYSYITPTCRYGYGPATRSRSAFGQNTTWWHMRSESTGGHGLGGRHGFYDGDGFLVLLSRDRSAARSQLRFLQSGDWLDQNTRAVVIEMTLFHPPTSIFTSVKLLTEFPPTGGVLTSHYVSSVHLYRYLTSFDHLVLACEFLFIIATSLRMYSIITSVLNAKSKYLREPWHWCHICHGVLSLAYLVCYVYRFVLVGETVERLRATYHEIYVDVAHVEEWDHIVASLVGFLAFLVLLELLKALRYRKPLAVFEKVLQRAAVDLGVCGAMFLLWVCAYACLGAALYASVSPVFSSPEGAVMAAAGLFTRHYGPASAGLEAAHFWGLRGARVFVASFLVVALGSLTAYTMAVLNYHYKRCRRETILTFSTRDTLAYYWDRVLFFFGLRTPELPDEDDSILPAEFTMAEVEYQVDEMLFKMNALAGTSNLPSKPPMYFTDSDATYGAGEDGFSSGGSEVRGGGGQQYEDDKLGLRINRIEENLLSRTSPNLARLLDSGAHDEGDKQLRNQLELEIFRQLQLGRSHPPLHTQLSSSTGYQASLSQSSSDSSRGGLLVRRNSRDGPERGGEDSSKNSRYQSPTLHPSKLLQQNTLSFPKAAADTGVLKQQGADSSDDNSSTFNAIPFTRLSPLETRKRGSKPSHSKAESKKGDSHHSAAIVAALAKHGIRADRVGLPIPLRELGGPRGRHKASAGSEETLIDLAASSGASSSTDVVPPRHRAPPPRLTKSADRAKTEARRAEALDALSLPAGAEAWASDDDDGDTVRERSGVLHKSRSHGRGKGRDGLQTAAQGFAFDNAGFDSDSERRKKERSLSKEKDDRAKR